MNQAPDGGAIRGVFAGLATFDVLHHVERMPAADEKVTARGTFAAAGGPAANAAVAFAALGGVPTLITALGGHPVADLVRSELRARGVTVRDLTPESADLPPMSSIAVTHGTGQRAVIGADAVTADTPPPADLDVLDRAAVLLVDGHHPRLAIAGARAAEAHGVPVVVDLGRWKPVMADLVRHAAAVVCSADARVPGTTDPRASAEALVALGIPDVVVTRGAEPVLWWSEGRHGQVAVPPVPAVDTLGAGDVFHGAYAWAVASGADVTEAISLGIDVATLRVRHAGPRTWLDQLEAPDLSDRPRETADRHGVR